VLASNFLVTFFGWEGVGVCSYFLIAFWFGRPTAASAGKKAMIYNRIGDAGFLLAAFLIFERTQSLDYLTVFSRLGHVGTASLVAIALLLFLGAAGKSAQIPLFPWLADAMEGPTPVSALIHAATMVTAGVYLMCRINPILHLVPDAAHVIAWVGVITAFVAATIGCAQTDIKKVLAYSTVSQLGYMFLAAGSGAYVAAIFLMLTHAFYKALLFLGAGSVIHGMDDEQDIKKMGALRKVMPLTAATFLIGWLSIAGVPPFSGFWAKSDVLINAWNVSPALWAFGAVTAVLTAYYMGREYLLVFMGDRRWAEARPGFGEEHAAGVHHPHDPRWVMTLPLVVLGFCSVFGGFIDLPFHPNFTLLERWLDPVVGKSLLVRHD
jgi:NADH-quinone oxidoreductase subunit L